MIFQLELSSLDSELSQLQALLSAKQQQRNLYSQLQQQTEGYLVGLAKLKDQIAETVGGGAIANLKSAVLTLFDSGNHGGNQSIDPTPDTDPMPGGEPEDDDFALNGDCLTTDDLDDIDSAPLTGQACDWASPFASHLACVLWEDAPLTGQYCTVTSEDNENKGTSEGEPMSYVQFVEVSDKVGYIKVCHSGEIKATYAGFTRKDRAEAWGRLLAMTYNIASGFEVRPAKHLPFKWELKLWDMSINQIQKFAAEDLTKSPRVEANASAKTESPAQQLGIEPPTGWGKPQVEAPSQPTITPGALVRHCTDAKFNTFEYGIVQELSESSAQIWNEQEGSSKSVAIASLELIASDPQYAKVLDSKSEWVGETFVIIQTSKAGLGYSVLTPKGIIWFRADGVEILDAEIEESTPPAEPTQPELPIYQRSDGSFEVEQSVKEQASILEVGDIVEIVGSRHPQHFGLVGTVESLNHFSELPIAVRTSRGLKGYLRSDLKFISKGEKSQSKGLQPGQVLMGSRIVTSGNYIGLRRSAASFNTAEKIATIQLAKDLQNLGFDPQLADKVMAGGEVDDASDF